MAICDAIGPCTMVCVSSVWFSITGLPLASTTGLPFASVFWTEMVCGSMSLAVV